MTPRSDQAAEPDPRITKRRVTMKSVTLDPSGVTVTTSVTDYVPDDERGILEPYVADARTRWQYVEVSEEFDAGPGGYDGPTAIPRGVPVVDPDGTETFVDFPHPRAGTYFPASDCTDCTHAPEGYSTAHPEG